MEITSKTLGLSYPLKELTQGMAEELVNLMAAKSTLDGIVYQREYIEAARQIGWVVCPVMGKDAPRRVVKFLFSQLAKAWEDANTIPND